jgi:hypothetical protein
MRILIAVATVLAFSGSAALACNGKTAWLKNQSEKAAERTVPSTGNTAG